MINQDFFVELLIFCIYLFYDISVRNQKKGLTVLGKKPGMHFRNFSGICLCLVFFVKNEFSYDYLKHTIKSYSYQVKHYQTINIQSAQNTKDHSFVFKKNCAIDVLFLMYMRLPFFVHRKSWSMRKGSLRKTRKSTLRSVLLQCAVQIYSTYNKYY